MNFSSGGKSYSFAISTGTIAKNLISRNVIVNPNSFVGMMNTSNSITTSVNNSAINTGRTRWESAERTRARGFLHDAIHQTPEEMRALCPNPNWGGALQNDHQDEYNKVADDILGPH